MVAGNDVAIRVTTHSADAMQRSLDCLPDTFPERMGIITSQFSDCLVPKTRAVSLIFAANEVKHLARCVKTRTALGLVPVFLWRAIRSGLRLCRRPPGGKPLPFR